MSERMSRFPNNDTHIQLWKYNKYKIKYLLQEYFQWKHERNKYNIQNSERKVTRKKYYLKLLYKFSE